MFNKKNKEEEYKVFCGGGIVVYNKTEFEKIIKKCDLVYRLYPTDNFYILLNKVALDKN